MPQKMTIIPLLFAGHLLCYSASITLRHIIRRYIKKKAPGHQSVLDLLLLDIFFLQTFYYTDFMIVMLAGMLHGQVPYVLSQIMLALCVIPMLMSTCLCQFFLMIKGILIFRGQWIAEMTDTSIKRITRIGAFFWTNLILFGNFWLQGPKPAVLTTFLTGSPDNT